MTFSFGTFDSICSTAALQVCPLVGSAQGTEPSCYSRNVEIGGTLIFQPGACFIHIVALIMTAIMVAHIRSKYTAVGRKEIVLFFYIYALIELLGMFVDSGVIPTSHVVYPWFAAVHVGLIVSIFWCLLVNGFVGLQFAEDGTPLSLWSLRISCFVVWGISFFISIATFNQYAGFSYMKPMGLYIVYLVFPIVCVAIYVISQLVLVFRTLDDRWVLGDIVFGVAFFTCGCIILFVFSVTICDAVEHYIDGLFIFVLCMLLSVMMVYKYWDSITKEDLEFAVGDKGALWEVKDPLLATPNPEFAEDDQSMYSPNKNGGGSLVGGYGGRDYYANVGSGSSRGGGSVRGYSAAPMPQQQQQQHQQQRGGKGWYGGN
ncbi:Chitin synthase III catalytic subunit [Phaffia rhodozyma]|uniref:Chitin synthase export chaperone n=1 Tax=Phaffia rhodozyma TaxID=264483 RepID=A0A0F7SHK1_PHARH|nr:Chitin synthase III catalytic subunit [Phaffia rhodozyma]